MFHKAQNVAISGGFFTVFNEQNAMTGLQILYQHGSHGAAHDSVEHAPKCHPETRKTIVGDIMSWIEDRSRTSKILWFNGPAGAGKTAIAHTVSERCAAIEWLAGSFFFSRQALSARNDAARLFPTIAYQLSVAIPAVGKIIDKLVANDPAIVTKTLEIQLQKLIVEPLQQVLNLPPRPIVFILDGLDECKGEDIQSQVLQILGSVFQWPRVGGLSRICFIVTSRPEPWIYNKFDCEPLSRITRPVFLEQTVEANDDIRTFLRAGFTEIYENPEHRLTMSNVEKPWPSYRVLDDLVEKSSGQFIYPVTVLKFVGDPDYRPTDRLDIITSIPVIPSPVSTPKPLAALDQLYSQILSTSSNKQTTLQVLGALIAMLHSVPYPIFSSAQVELLRVAEKLLGLQLGDAPRALRTLHSLIHVKKTLIPDTPDDDLSPAGAFEYRLRMEDEIQFHHKTFIDYLVDPSRSLDYFIDMHQMHTQLALACLVMMETFSMQPASRIACVAWGYAIAFWDHHVVESGPPKQQLLQALQNIDIFSCYVDTLGSPSQPMNEECRNTIKRVALRPRVTVVGKVARKLSSKNDVINKKCPNPADIEIAQQFLIRCGAPEGPTKYDDLDIAALTKVADWMKESRDSPLELIRQYQILTNILRYYSRFMPDNLLPSQPDNFFTWNVDK